MKTTNYTAKLKNNVWTISSTEGNEVIWSVSVNDENLTDDERETLDNGTSNDLKNFVNNSGNF